MKKLFYFLALSASLSCNSNKKQTKAEPSTSDESAMGHGEMKDGISDYTNNKKSFMLTCHIDASNSLGSENTAQVDQFCECAWDKTKGKYDGTVVANNTKLEKDATLKDCYENARKK